MSLVKNSKSIVRAIVIGVLARALDSLSPGQISSLVIRLFDRLPKNESQTVFFEAARVRRNHLYDELKQITGCMVQDGPFKGMKLPDLGFWDKRDHIGKLLGFYEAELHTAIYDTLTKNHDCFVNIGCGDGFYAVGYALSTSAQIFAFDTSPDAQALCKICAEENGVLGRIQIGGSIDAFMLQNVLSKYKNPLLLIDCEGCEFYLMQPNLVPALENANFIVEAHNFVHPNIVNTLVERFRETHKIKLISEGPRDPNSSTFLRNRHGLIRWLAISEDRPETMEWFLGTPVRVTSS